MSAINSTIRKIVGIIYRGWSESGSQDKAVINVNRLDYDRGEGNYTELRKKIFKGKTVKNIIQDMKNDGYA